MDHCAAAVIQGRVRLLAPPCKVPPWGYPPKVGPSRSYPATPPWTLGRKVGSHPTTPPWTFAGNVGGGRGTLGPKVGGGGDHLETVQSRCAVRAVRWRGPPRHLGAQSPRVGGRPMTVGGRRPSGGGAVKLFLVVADIQRTFPPSKRGPEPCGGASVGGGRWN